MKFVVQVLLNIAVCSAIEYPETVDETTVCKNSNDCFKKDTAVVDQTFVCGKKWDGVKGSKAPVEKKCVLFSECDTSTDTS